MIELMHNVRDKASASVSIFDLFITIFLILFIKLHVILLFCVCPLPAFKMGQMEVGNKQQIL